MKAVEEESWVVTEGAAGMENQCLGLAERLPFPVRTLRVRLRTPWRQLAPYSLGAALRHLADTSERFSPPWPRLLIGCGRQSIPLSIAVRRASGRHTITVQCQDPRVAVSNFDLVVPAEHDELSGSNIFPIVGSPNRVTPAQLKEAWARFAPLLRPLRSPRVAVLIGGASRTHGSLDTSASARLGTMLQHAARDHGLMVSTSRRTSIAAAGIVHAHLASTDALIWNGNDENPYLGMLAWADAFVVTADSVNMICEAASTGKPVHVFPLPGGGKKAHLFQRSLAQRGITRPFCGRIEQWSYTALDETGRAVERIKDLLDLTSCAPDMQGKGP